MIHGVTLPVARISKDGHHLQLALGRRVKLFAKMVRRFQLDVFLLVHQEEAFGFNRAVQFQPIVEIARIQGQGQISAVVGVQVQRMKRCQFGQNIRLMGR